MIHRLTDPVEQRKAYRRGRAASMRDWTTRPPLDAADWRGEPHEWYDGYTDHATGRDIWEGPDGRRPYAPTKMRCRVQSTGDNGCALPAEHDGPHAA